LRRKLFVGIMLFFSITLIFNNISYAEEIKDGVIISWQAYVELQTVKDFLKEHYDYTDVVKDKMIIKNINVKVEGPRKYKLFFNVYDLIITEEKTGNTFRINNILEKKLKNTYGYDGTNKNWEGKAIIKFEFDDSAAKEARKLGLIIDTADQVLRIESIHKLDEDIEDDGKNIEMEIKKNEGKIYSSSVARFDSITQWVKDKLWQLLQKILIYLIQTFVNNGDTWMKWLNYFELKKFGLVNSGMTKIVYRPEEAKSYTDLDEYIKLVGTPSETDYKITIKDIGTGIDEDNAEIPFFPVDIYSISSGNLPAFDVNFFEVNKELHPDDSSAWNIARNFFTVFTRFLYFLCAAILIVTLIWHGINLVWFTLDNPNKKKEHTSGIQRFGKSLLLLFGTLLIMTLSIYGSKNFIKGFVNLPDGKQFPIRVTAEEAKIEFSTNYTGYLRYMSEILEPDFHTQKFHFAFKYNMMVFLNWIVAIVMIIRMVLIFVLSICGPPIAVWYAIGNDKAKSVYNIWCITYVSTAAIQAVFLLICIALFEFGTN